MDVRRRTCTTQPIELVRADLDEGRGVAMIGGIDYDDVFTPGVRSCESQRQLIGFAARTNKVANRERRRQRSTEALCVAYQVFVQVAGVGVEHGHLLLPRFDHARMAMPDVTDVVHGIKVGTSILVVEVLHRAAHNIERAAI